MSFFLTDELDLLALIDELRSMVIENFYPIYPNSKPLGYEYLEYILENHRNLLQISAFYFYSDLPDCCKDFNETGAYSHNRYCYFDLLLSYGINPGVNNVNYSFATDDYFLPQLGVWSHIFKLINSNLYFQPYDLFINLLEFEKIDLLKKLVIKNKYFKDKGGVLLNDCPAFQKLNNNIKLDLLEFFKKEDIQWIE